MILALFVSTTLFLVRSIHQHESSKREDYVSSFQCDYYLGESLIPQAGRGIFYFGSDSLAKDQVLEDSPTLFIRYEQIYQSILEDYIFESYHKDYGILLLGIASLINHGGNQFSVQHYDSSDNTAESRSPSVYMSSLSAPTFYYLENVLKLKNGEELLIDYGEEWFENRSTFVETSETIMENRPHPKQEVSKSNLKGKICLATIELGETTKYQGGNGVFTKKSFQKGELIIVSPLLVLPYFVVEESKNSSLLMNYCYYNEDKAPSFAFLPLTISSLMNHYKTMYLSDESLIYPLVDNDQPNVVMRWFNWSFFIQCSSEKEKRNEDCLADDRLHNIDTSVFKHQEREKLSEIETGRGFRDVMIGYYAMKDIKEKDELFLDYGHQWENAYSDFLVQENYYDIHPNSLGSASPPPSNSFLFHQPIPLPESLFP
jgi:hypothetical protein